MGEAGSVMERAQKGDGGLRLLQLAAFFSTFDSFAVAPMLVSIAAALGARAVAGTHVPGSLFRGIQNWLV